MFLNDGVHDGLGEHGLVNLVVSVLAVAHQVDNHVLMPGGAPLGGNVGHQHHGLRVVRVYVENWGVHHPAHVGAVGGRAGVAGVGGEADLIVGNNVDCPLKKVNKY